MPVCADAHSSMQNREVIFQVIRSQGMSDTILSLKNITKTYPGVLALDQVSLDFKRGEVHAKNHIRHQSELITGCHRRF